MVIYLSTPVLLGGGGGAPPRTALALDTPDLPAREPRVRVRGHVYHRGLAVAGWELTFQPAGPGSDVEADWDITGDDGQFEVQVPAASYTVRIGDAGAWATDLLVPSSERELTVDFDLPLQLVECAGR